MTLIASAKPGNIVVHANGKDWIYRRVISSTPVPVKERRKFTPPKPRPKDIILVFFLKDLFLIFEEGCLDCFTEKLKEDIKE